ncbi:hypothetical protein BD413DRAFT_708756 [Trametes elegans]|nr:hypothetical protein BD413DRAFT_708756 [Trametes elegans]
MKLSAVLLPSLLCAASASAQYLSAGWNPGQPVPPNPGDAPPPAQTFERAASPSPAPSADASQTPAPAPPAPASSGASIVGGLAVLLGLDKLLTAGPVASLLGKAGVNVSEAIALGAQSPWDQRIPLITDENFEEVIVNEPLTPEEEKERVWFLIISVTAGSNNAAVSKFVDESFDQAYNETLIAGDLPHVRWGRIDYISVTYLTTKWAIWTGPYIVVLTDRGQTLRFFKADRVRITPELLRELLVEEFWRNSPPWKTNFAPGGKREWVLHYYALGLTRVFNFLNRFPRWILMIASGAFASLVMRLLHRNPSPAADAGAGAVQKRTAEEKEAKAKAVVPAASDASSTAVGSSAAAPSTTGASPSKSKGKQRKNAKK